MVKPEQFEFTHYEQVRLLGYTQFAWDQTQEIVVSIFTNPGREPTVSWTGTSPMPLSFFLPGSSRAPFIGPPQGPTVLMDRVKQCITAEAAARLSNPVTK